MRLPSGSRVISLRRHDRAYGRSTHPTLVSTRALMDRFSRSPAHRPRYSMDFRLADRRRSFKKVEIATLVGLGDMLGVEAAEAARVERRARRPLRPPP